MFHYVAMHNPTNTHTYTQHCELYVLGAPAALVLGPDSGNLMGARTGAARAAHVLQELVVERGAGQATERAKREVAALRFRYDRRWQCVKSPGLGHVVATKKERKRDKGCGCC